ncbi:MAG: DUF5104 domain-containing protein, partial [Oscillospiraceae bacterium]|nr:DUF5104 domain-containing protein [Oscillospiraceae bacterium]
CNGRLGGVIIIEESKADARIEQIISALKDRDSEALKSLFSKKALDEANNFDNEVENLLEFLQGDIVSWERDGWASDQSSDHGKTTLMIRPGFFVVTDLEEYSFFLIDYNIDTIDPDNEGLYMIEVTKSSYSGSYEPWQDRMRAGVCIIE